MQPQVNKFFSSALSKEIHLRPKERLRDGEYLGERRVRLKVADRRPGGGAEGLIDG